MAGYVLYFNYKLATFSSFFSFILKQINWHVLKPEMKPSQPNLLAVSFHRCLLAVSFYCGLLEVSFYLLVRAVSGRFAVSGFSTCQINLYYLQNTCNSW